MSDETNLQQGREDTLSANHKRDDSVYSMDTFVAECPSEPGDHSLKESEELKADALNSHLSSSNSNQSGRPPTAGKSISQTSVQDTIEPAVHQPSRSSTRKNSDSDGVGTIDTDSIPPIQPVTPFFNASYYDDSDVSEGSLVFQTKPELLQTAQPSQSVPSSKIPHGYAGRDRLPSFDSVGSTSSIKYVSPNRHAPPMYKPPNNPSILLPYPERRKKKQQQQQRQKSSVRQKSMQAQSTPLPPPFFLPQGQSFPPPSNPFPLMPPYPPADMGFFPEGLQPYPPYPPYPGPPAMPQSQNFPAPHPPMPMFFHVPVNPDGSAVYPFPHPMQPVPPSQPLSPSRRSRPPVAQKPTKSNIPRPRTPLVRDSVGSSFDTSEGDEMESSKAIDLPPPPPPASNPLMHVRQESTGSVSSLGSVDRDDSMRYLGRNPEFLASLNPPQKQDDQAFHSTVQGQNPASSAQNTGQSVSLGMTSDDGHQPLHSIVDDTLEGENDVQSAGKKYSQEAHHQSEEDSLSRASDVSDDEASAGENSGDVSEPDERTRLLPQSTGISSKAYYDAAGNDRSGRCLDKNSFHPIPDTSKSGIVDYGKAARAGNHALSLADAKYHKRNKKQTQKRRKDRRGRRTQQIQPDDSSDSSSHTSTSSKDHNEWLKKRAKLLEKERAKLMKQWRAEAREEEEKERYKRAKTRSSTRLMRLTGTVWKRCFECVFGLLTWCESFVANLPLTIGAIALAIANLGVNWFKFAEETMDSCEPVHFHSAQCTFPEFPGCFYCDTRARMYKLALGFHWSCNSFAAVLAFGFIAKLFLARRVVLDELSSPTTASPAGLLCMTLDVVFAGRGTIGMLMVSASSAIHLCIAIWFIYMALAYHIMPDPSWFPNTTGIGISAVKIWLYYPMFGHFLMAISLTLNFFFFPVSLIRVAMNRKISATVGWMQMSAPNISLYALTIMAQPSFEEEHPDITSFQRMHRRVYLPLMHVLFGLCLLGMFAAVTSLVVRWPEFSKVPFSPAHAAFCCPTLSHVNAIQAYRTAINSFSTLPPDSSFRLIIYWYWIICLVSGTFLTVIIAAKFLYSLPAWTHIDLSDEIEPPAPYETAMSLTNMIATGETLIQSFVSPAILQANETGVLVFTRDAHGNQRYVRTRKVTALGFEPMMNMVEMERERELLLEWVGQNPPRLRHRTLSVPGIDFSYAQAGPGLGAYGADEERASQWISRSRRRANTYDARQSSDRRGRS